MPTPPLLQEAAELALAWGMNWKEAIRALIVLPLIYAMLTQLRTSADPNAYGFWAALGDGVIVVVAFLACCWLIERYHLDDQEEPTPWE